jgi:uncharacterized protein (DUF111 family)
VARRRHDSRRDGGAGVEPNFLREQLSLLPSRFQIDFETVNRSGLSATYARVETAHEHKHRHLSDIKKIIEGSRCPGSESNVQCRSSRVWPKQKHAYTTSRRSRSLSRGRRARRDRRRVGAAICFDALQIDRFVCSPLHVGSGMVKMAHGSFRFRRRRD